MHRRFEHLEAKSGAPAHNCRGARRGDRNLRRRYLLFHCLEYNYKTRKPARPSLFTRIGERLPRANRRCALRFHAAFPTIEQTLEVYAYKTALYYLPSLCAGAILAGHSETQSALEALGLNLGVLFQIKDDYLGLFGDEKQLGKPIGSDIKEGKKTPYMILLNDALTPIEKSRFSKVFGNPSISLNDVAYIRALILEKGIDAEIEALESRFAKRAKESLKALCLAYPGLKAQPLSALEDFIAYSLSRKK